MTGVRVDLCNMNESPFRTLFLRSPKVSSGISLSIPGYIIDDILLNDKTKNAKGLKQAVAKCNALEIRNHLPPGQILKSAVRVVVTV